ncbi:MAG: hypothetical protein MI924_38690 [Chloroflexales bacterium]|nr:hypothetical protein [Chloroflexales bacterium]
MAKDLQQLKLSGNKYGATMASKRCSHTDFVAVLAQYDLGAYTCSVALQRGAVQTNYVLGTTRGTFVFRYYENRS